MELLERKKEFFLIEMSLNYAFNAFTRPIFFKVINSFIQWGITNCLLIRFLTFMMEN